MPFGRSTRRGEAAAEKEFDTFENPTADGAESPTTSISPTAGDIERHSKFADEDDETVAPPLALDLPRHDSDEDGEGSPMTPSPHAVDPVTGEMIDLKEHEMHRGSLSYTLFFLISLALLLGYGVFALFLIWVYYIVPNQLSATAFCVAGAVPFVQYLGLSGARRNSQPQLQLYAFAVVLAITLQISVVLVALLDTEGHLSNAYLNSCALGARRLCRSMDEVGELPFGVSAAEMNAVCTCVPDALELVNGTQALLMFNETQGSSNETQVEDNIMTCLRRKAEEKFELGPYDIAIGMVCTLTVELCLAFVAYNMMKDIDVTDAKKDAKIKGGPATGHMRGMIVGGLDLRSSSYNAIMQKNKFSLKSKKSKKKSTQPPRSISQRFAVLTVRTPGLHPKKRKRHIVQTVKTKSIEDDSSPDWSCTFGGHDHDSTIWTYEASRRITIEVFDEASKGKGPQLIGKGKVEMDGASLPDLDTEMDGVEALDIPLVWENPEEGNRQRPAGSVSVNLIWVPSPNLHLKTAILITKSWYFESTVLFMVLLSMVVLAFQSPAAPPSLMGRGTLRILEIFVATHMGVELLMEIVVLLSAKGKHPFRDPWIMLSFLVMACNWLSIIAPAMPLAGELTGVTDAAGAAAGRSEIVDIDYSAGFKRLVSVGRVFRIVRPIRTLRMIKNVDIIVQVISESAGLFATVCGLLVFLLAIFSLVGMSSFAGALQYECIGLPSPDGQQEGMPPTCSDSQKQYAANMEVACPLQCPISLKCSEDHYWCAPLGTGPRQIGGDEFGFRDFDNFWRAMVTMFVQTTGDGGMHTIPMALHDSGVHSSNSAWLISFVASVCLNIIALNLFLAVCCSAYSDVASQAERLEMAQDELEAYQRHQLLEEETEAERDIREAAELAELAEAKKTVEERIEELNWEERDSRCPQARKAAKRLIQSEWFERITSTVILGNTVTMAMVHKDMSDELKDWLSMFEMSFLLCFILEAFAKFLGIGRSIYFASRANRFDLFVIAGSVLGYIATFYDDEVKTKLGLNVEAMQSLRAIRLLRALQIARLLHRQKALIVVLRTIFRAWRPLMIHSFFCLFSLCMFSIIGMHILGGSLGKDDLTGLLVPIEVYNAENPANFESFFRGVLTVFEMTVGEEWSHCMYWYAKHASAGYGYPPWCVQLFFIIMYVWMNCVLFSLYVAMLLDNFSVPEADKVPTQKRIYERQQRANVRTLKKLQRSHLVDTIKESKAKGHAHTKDASAYDKLHHAASGLQGHDDLHAAHNKSFYLFKLDSAIRLSAAKMQAGRFFKSGILVLILFSCLSLALEGAGQGSGNWADENLGDFFKYLNMVVLGAFILEGMLKSIIHGFIARSGPTLPYLATKMNRLDFAIIVLCLGSYLPFTPDGGAWARALRLARVITPMLNLTKNPEIKLVFISFVRAGPDTAVVLLPLVLMVVVFAILGVATFQGGLMGCVHSDDRLQFLDDMGSFPFGNETLCAMTSGYVWTSPSFNFDNCMRALATLVTGITDGAHAIMLSTTATNPATKVFWILFHLVFSCFFVNLFIGVLSASFEKSSGSALATVPERQWHSLQRELHNFRPIHSDPEDLRPDPKTTCCGKNRSTPHFWWRLRSFMFTLAINPMLEHTWRVGILANTITLSSDRFPTVPAHRAIVEKLNLGFLCICTAEVVIKMLGFGLRTYFSDGWLISDFVLVSISLCMRFFGVQSGVEVLRVMRVFRMFVLASKFPDLVALIDTVIKCLRASMALVLITSLIVYLYAILGMNFFGLLPDDTFLEKFDFSENEIMELRQNSTILLRVCPQCTAYTDYSNFNNFFRALRLLMQCVFGQGIGGFITDMEHLGASFWSTFGFFASFYMLAVWVCINLLIVTVLSNFDAVMTNTDDGERALKPVDFDGFSHAWASLTVGVHGSVGTERITPTLLENLSTKLQEESEAKGTAFEEPSNVNFEDGDPALVGTLTVHIQRADGLLAAGQDLRPYARMTAFGSNSSSNLKMSTPVLKASEDGDSAVWDSSDHIDPYEEDRHAMKVHVTAFHTHLDFEVSDGFQFCDDLLGGNTISMDEIRLSCENGGGRTTRTLRMMGDTTFKKRKSKPASDWKRWERYASFVDEDEVLDEDVANTDVERTDAQLMQGLAEQEAASKTEDATLTDKQRKEVKKLDKKRKKAVRAAAKADRKLAKKKLKAEKKAAKKAAKKRKKLEAEGVLSDESEEEDMFEEEPHRFFRNGWEETGLTLTVLFDFEPKLGLEKKKTFLQDYSVRYAHKETNIGVEGWMEVSENSGPFKSRFCYIQQYPRPCFKFCRDAANVNTLETLGLRGNMKFCTVPATQILSLYSGHDKKSATTKRKNISLQMVTYEEAKTGRKEEAQIGLLAGTVVGATGLKTQQESEGVLMVEEILFGQLGQLDGGAVVPNFASEGQTVEQEADDDKQDEEGEHQEVDEFEEEEEDVVELSRPLQYMAVRRTTLRNGSSVESEQRGHAKRGEIILATHVKMVGNLKRVRCKHGWCSTTTISGRNTLLIPEDSDSKFYRAKKDTPIGRFIELSKCPYKQGKPPVGFVRKGEAVEALEFAVDTETGVSRIRVSEGWISEIDTTLRATIDPYCVIQAVPVGGWPAPSTSKLSRLPRASASKDGTNSSDLEDSRQRAAQSLRTHVIEDSTNPEWNHGFDFKVFPSSWKLLVSVYDANSQSTDPMGTGEIEYGRDDGYQYIPGPQISGSGVGRTVQLSAREPTMVKVQLMNECEKGKVKAGGSVMLEMSYTELISRDELIAARDKAGGNLHDAMMIDEKAEKVYRFRCMSSELRRSWLAALRWVATDCPPYSCRNGMPDRLPPAALVESDLLRLENDISLVDLPFSRVSLLIQSLYNRRVMGSHKPTLRWMTYVIFNLETFGWSQGSQQQNRKRRKQLGFDGVTFKEIRGLNFHLTLERLCLLHYGKAKCLSYDQQMQEYHSEIYHCSMHLVCSAVSWWVARRRTGKTWGGHQWPWDARFRKYPAVYQMALEGACASRVRSLATLRKCIDKRSKPDLMGVTLPSRVRLAPKAAGDGTGCCGGGGSGLMLEDDEDGADAPLEREMVEAAFHRLDLDGSGTLDRKEVKEALVNMLPDDLDEHEVDTMFRRMDVDRSGDVDMKEFVDAMMTILQEPAKSEAHAEDDADSDLDELQMSLGKLQESLLSEVNE